MSYSGDSEEYFKQHMNKIEKKENVVVEEKVVEKEIKEVKKENEDYQEVISEIEQTNKEIGSLSIEIGKKKEKPQEEDGDELLDMDGEEETNDSPIGIGSIKAIIMTVLFVGVGLIIFVKMGSVLQESNITNTTSLNSATSQLTGVVVGFLPTMIIIPFAIMIIHAFTSFRDYP
jgi:hypothetical protein